MRLASLHLAAASIVAVSALLLPVSPVAAQSDDGEPGGCVIGCGQAASFPDAVDASARREFPSGGGGPSTIGTSTGSSFFDRCTFTLVPAGVEVSLHPTAGANNRSWDVDYWVVFCPPAVTAYTFYPDGGRPPAPIIGDMIQDAYVRTPVVAFDPVTSPDGDDDIPLVTQLPTFLWVDETVWNTPVSAEASIPGFTVRTTAVPALATWSGGDGEETCTGGEMVPYQFGIGGDDAQPSDCVTVFKQSSAVADHEIGLAASWTVSYTCSNSVCGGPLPDITTNSVRPVTVAEIQAVATNTP